jgi:hypothetical protein
VNNIIDNFDKCVVHATHNFFTQEGTVPAIAKLLVKFKESISFKERCSSLRRIVRALVFWRKKTRTNRDSH